MLAFYYEHKGGLCCFKYINFSVLEWKNPPKLFLALCSSDRIPSSTCILNLFWRSPKSGLCISMFFETAPLQKKSCSPDLYWLGKFRWRWGNAVTPLDRSHVPSLCPQHWPWNSFSTALPRLRKYMVPPHCCLCCIWWLWRSSMRREIWILNPPRHGEELHQNLLYYGWLLA